MFLEGKAFRLAFWKILSRPIVQLSPNIVVRNMLKGSKILFGQDVIKQIAFPPTTSAEISKIFIVSWIMSIFGLISSMFSWSSTRFSLEAMKWYILNVYSIFNNKTATVDQSLRFALSKHFFSGSFVTDKFAELRREYSYDFIFCAVIPVYLLIAHLRLNNYLRHEQKTK